MSGFGIFLNNRLYKRSVSYKIIGLIMYSHLTYDFCNNEDELTQTKVSLLLYCYFPS